MKSSCNALFLGALAVLTIPAGTMTMSSRAFSAGYKFPSPNEGIATSDENTQFLQRLSKGVAGIAQKANQAIVFVSVFKNVQGTPMGMVDPFEFFFGPGGPGGMGGPHGNPQGNQRQRGNQQAPQRREGGLGSGFIIDLDMGYIMTNNHVVQDADEIELKLSNGESYKGKIVGRDKNTDVAVVQVKDKAFSRKGLAQLGFADSEKVQSGDFVLALGAPFGLEASLSFGIVSAIGRDNLGITKLGSFIQTDAAINPGNSGGPLLNMSGQVIGMNTAIFSKSGAYNGIGFAVPANFAKTVAEQLINEGKVQRGYMGVGLQPIDQELHKSLGLPDQTTGSLVREVMPGGPGAKAGVEAGDVITAVDGKPVKSDNEVVNAIGFMRPGATTELQVFREGKTRIVKVKVEKWPSNLKLANSSGGDDDDDQGPQDRDEDQGLVGKPGPLGLSITKLTPPLKQQNHIVSESGLIVTDVKADSPAARAGIQPGDVILQVNGKVVTTPESLKAQSKGANGRVLLRIERAGSYFFVPVRTE